MSSSVAVARLRATGTEAAAPIALGAGAAVLVGGLGAASGGYFPTSWGWPALALLWVAGIALALGQVVTLRPLELGLIAAALGLLGWIALSNLWTTDHAQAPLEAQRMVVYVAFILAALLVVSRSGVLWLLGGVWGGIVAISLYSLATRLFPERFSTFNPIAGYRLSTPIGYWNGLGLFVAMGALLALGLAARGGLLVRAAAAASLPVLLTTLYFTYSRGAWLATAVGLLAAVALDPRRLQLTAVALAVACPAAVVVAVGAASGALTRLDAPLATATSQGHHLAWIVVVAALVSAVLAAAFCLLERRVTLPVSVRIVYAVALSAAALIAMGVGLATHGGPSALASRAYHSLNARPPKATDLNQRLFNLASPGRVNQFRVAWWDYRAHPWLGAGPGSYEQYWAKHKPHGGQVRDVHNLYLETLAEQGAVGLALLVSMLGIPLVGAWRARRIPIVPAAFGAYVAYLAHASIDWDWELTAVTIAALACGIACLKSDAAPGKTILIGRGARYGGLALVVALAVFSFVGLVGNRALASAKQAATAHDWRRAEVKAQEASDWAPWSSEALQVLGNSQYALGRPGQGYLTLLEAARKDPNNWSIWYDVGDAAPTLRLKGLAYRRAAALNPLSPNIAMLRDLGILPKQATR